jgi:phage terminase Nu1 subunit (DNA packaging protein)
MSVPLLDRPCTQAEFGALLGITQQAVSDMVARNVLIPGDTLAGWIRNRDEHLRNQAAGRDSELAKERAIATRVARERNEIKLAADRGEFAPVVGLEMVLAAVGGTVAARLEALMPKLHKLCPELTPQAVAAGQREVKLACDEAAAASLALLDKLEAEAQEMEALAEAERAKVAGDAGVELDGGDVF